MRWLAVLKRKEPARVARPDCERTRTVYKCGTKHWPGRLRPVCAVRRRASESQLAPVLARRPASPPISRGDFVGRSPTLASARAPSTERSCSAVAPPPPRRAACPLLSERRPRAGTCGDWKTCSNLDWLPTLLLCDCEAPVQPNRSLVDDLATSRSARWRRWCSNHEMRPALRRCGARGLDQPSWSDRASQRKVSVFCVFCVEPHCFLVVPLFLHSYLKLERTLSGLLPPPTVTILRNENANRLGMCTRPQTALRILGGAI